MVHVIAIGNKLMKDDGVSLEILDLIKSDLLKKYKQINLIKAETDVMYCLEQINQDDFIIVIDSSFYHQSVGVVNRVQLTKDSIKEIKGSSHQITLPYLLLNEEIVNHLYLVTIEVKEIDYGFDLSEDLRKQINQISKKVLCEIEMILKENNYA